MIILTFSCYDEQTRDNEEIILIRDLATGPVLADGTTLLTFRISLGTETLNGEHRNVKFTSDGVQFVLDEVYVKKEGETIVSYIPKTVPGTYDIKAEISDMNTVYITRSITLVAPQSKDVLSIRFSPSSASADGTTPITVDVNIKNYKKAKVELSTSQGKFADSQDGQSIVLDVDDAGHASTTLIPGVSAETYLISAKISDTPIATSSSFTASKAYPDDLYIEPGAYTIVEDKGSIDIEVNLLRNNGKASKGIPVDLRAWYLDNDDTVDVGSLKGFPFQSDEDQKVKFSFALDKRPADAGTTVNITATVLNDKKKKLRKSIEVLIVEDED